MATTTLSPAGTRSPSGHRRASDVLTLVADPMNVGPEQPVPDWLLSWCTRSRWQLRGHPGAGPFAAADAARDGARVLVLRPDTAWPSTAVLGAREPGRKPDRRGAGRRPGSAASGIPQPPVPQPPVPQPPVSQPPVSQPRTPQQPTPRVVAAVRSLPDDRRVVTDAATCAALLGGRLVIVHAVPRSFAERSVGLDGAITDGRRLLDAAADVATRHERGCAVDRELLRARPYEVVGETLRADLLVVGGPHVDRHGGGPAGDGLGLVAHSALHHAPCPVLLTPR